MAIEMSYWTIASITIGLLAILPTIMGLFSKNKFVVEGKTVLVTGASQGMGKSAAMQLAAKGANVIIVARDVKKLEGALNEIKASASNPSTQRFHYISADLASPGGNTEALCEATKWNNGRAPDIVWCIAGSSYPHLWIDTPMEKLRSQMDINFWAAAYMAHSVLNSWLSPTSPNKGTERHFIFTCSVLAFYPIVGYTPYSPAKAAMRNLSDSLVQEVLLYGEDVKIHTVFPGTILSPGFENENKTKPEVTFLLEKDDPEQTPYEVAQRAIQGLENGQYLITVSFLGAAMRAQMWSGMRRNNWLYDTVLTLGTALVWPFIRRDLDGKVEKFGKENGHPSTYTKGTLEGSS